MVKTQPSKHWKKNQTYQPKTMKIIASLIPAILLLLFCNCNRRDSPEPRQAPWYSDWFSLSFNEGTEFHSEFLMPAGSSKEIIINYPSNIEVGFIVKESSKLNDLHEMVTMGESGKKGRAGATVGTSQTYTPTNSLLKITFKNESSVDTRVMAYLKK